MSSNNLFLIYHVGDPAIARALCLHSQGGRGGTATEVRRCQKVMNPGCTFFLPGHDVGHMQIRLLALSEGWV